MIKLFSNKRKQDIVVDWLRTPRHILTTLCPDFMVGMSLLVRQRGLMCRTVLTPDHLIR